METKTFQLKLRNKNKHSCNILLEGDLSYKNIKNIRNELYAAISDCNNLNIDFQNINGFDLTIIQLIQSLKRSEKKLTLTGNLPLQINEVLEHSGVKSLLGSN